MNKKLEEFARNSLKSDLMKCTARQINLFRRMYAHDKPDISINQIIDEMPDYKLDIAMRQVETTIENNKQKG